MTAAILRYDPPPSAPGPIPGSSDRKGCFGIVMLAVAFLGALLALPVAKAAKRPDPGRCPRCHRSFWDCNCPNSGEE